MASRVTCRPSTTRRLAHMIRVMGSVHKFQRPPKNERQFQGYRPDPGKDPRDHKPGRRRLANWQKSLIAWALLILIATGLWAIGVSL